MRRFLALALFASALAISVPTSALLAQEPEKHATAEAGNEGEEPEEQNAEAERWKWPNFAILAVLMGIALYKALPKNFAERTAAIQKDIKEAQKVKADAEQRAAQVEARLKALGSDVEAFRKEAATDMREEGERIRQETAVQMQRVEAQSSLEIENAGKIARRELKQYSAELALQLAEQRVRTRLDANTEAALIDGFVADLAREASKN